MSKRKITKLSDLEQIDGKIDETGIPVTLDSLFSTGTFGKYRTLNKEEYSKEINSFNIAELRQHAIEKGFIPKSDVNRLKKQLLIEFDKFVLANNQKILQPKKHVITDKKREEALKILSIVKS